MRDTNQKLAFVQIYDENIIQQVGKEITKRAFQCAMSCEDATFLKHPFYNAVISYYITPEEKYIIQNIYEVPEEQIIDFFRRFKENTNEEIIITKDTSKAMKNYVLRNFNVNLNTHYFIIEMKDSIFSYRVIKRN